MDFQKNLKDYNLSITPVRIAVLESLVQNPHSDASALFHNVQKKIQTTSIQAVYKNLNVLVEHGMVREIKPKGMSALYETRIGDNHHHIVCRKCGCIHDTNCLDTAPCLTSIHSHGFEIDEAEIIFWGTCPSCQNNINKKEGKNHE